VIVGLFPYFLSSMGRVETFQAADRIALGLAAFGEIKLGRMFRDYRKFSSSAEGIRRWIHEVVSLICEKFFPKHEMFVFSVLVEMIEHGPSMYQRSILKLLQVFLTYTQLQRSLLNTVYLSVLAPITKHLDNSLWEESVKVLEVILQKSSDHVKQMPVKKLPEKSELAQMQTFTSSWATDDMKSTLIALKHVLSTEISLIRYEVFVPIHNRNELFNELDPPPPAYEPPVSDPITMQLISSAPNLGSIGKIGSTPAVIRPMSKSQTFVAGSIPPTIGSVPKSNSSVALAANRNRSVTLTETESNFRDEELPPDSSSTDTESFDQQSDSELTPIRSPPMEIVSQPLTPSRMSKRSTFGPINPAVIQRVLANPDEFAGQNLQDLL